MPEGAEVRHCSEFLSLAIKGELLTAVVPLSGKLSRTTIPIAKLGLPSQVISCVAVGKRIVIKLASGAAVTSTLGMSGWWYPGKASQTSLGYTARQLAYQSANEKHARLALVSGHEVLAQFTDPRNFGNFTCYAPTEVNANLHLVGLGNDLLALSDSIPLQDEPVGPWLQQLTSLAAKFATSKLPVGSLLLDQEKYAGLGNIYRAETLYLEKLNPFTLWCQLTPERRQSVLSTACKVLNIAYFTKGKMQYPMLNHIGHAVYGKLTCPLGTPVVTAQLGERTIFYSPTVQL